VERLGLSAGDSVVQNLEVTVHGGSANREQIVVGAHYDTHTGTPGADDNASGVAGILVLARAFVGAHPDRTIRFVLFANEEAPFFQTEQMGSLVYAKALILARVEVVAMINLESIGYYSSAPGSQRYPQSMAEGHPSIGDFAAVVGNPASRELVERLGHLMSSATTLPIISDSLPEDLPGVGWSDHWSFWKLGVPAVMITDTAPFRNPHYHRATDLPEHLDFDRMARLVGALEQALLELSKSARPSTRTPHPAP
jgi:Zn-dependent M28 family amino/carboxypeptidase